MTKEEAFALLNEIESVIRARPNKATSRHENDENIEWLGRACAVVNSWNAYKSPQFESYAQNLVQSMGPLGSTAYFNIMRMLQQARYDLKIQIDPPVGSVIDQGKVFQYFDEVRVQIELATLDVFFVDPYIDADFVSKYLGYVKPGVKIRLLTKALVKQLLPAAQMFIKETGASLEIRSHQNLHDRFLICDGKMCIQSGASFKDGAKNSPTMLVEICDAFVAVKALYEDLWSQACVEV